MNVFCPFFSNSPPGPSTPPAVTTLNLWHIRPNYDGDKDKESFVTYYTHFRPNGSIPQWLVDQKVSSFFCEGELRRGYPVEAA